MTWIQALQAEGKEQKGHSSREQVHVKQYGSPRCFAIPCPYHSTYREETKDPQEGEVGCWGQAGYLFEFLTSSAVRSSGHVQLSLCHPCELKAPAGPFRAAPE